MTERRKAPPPQLMFDDGSRVIQESSEARTIPSRISARGSASLSTFYEVDRLSQEIKDMLPKLKRSVSNDGWLCRVALQFPDELLQDAPEVCWAMERAVMDKCNGDDDSAAETSPLIFVLGDTTFGPCCPDEINALHLNADILVHYGHACLSPPQSLPVLYSFGVTDVDVSTCVDDILTEVKKNTTQRLLLLYQVQYHNVVESLQTQISERGDVLVVAGQIPPAGLVNNDDSDSDGDGNNDEKEEETKQETMILGGLQIPANLDLASFTLLFLGDSTLTTRQYINTMLRLLSMSSKGPAEYWTYSPRTQILETSLPRTLCRQLNRRFFLTQKARDASVFGILVGTLSQQHFTSVVVDLQKIIHDAGRACYTFAVGKINGAKLANFADIECFVLVACPETSLLEHERDLHVPVITPLELDIALGNSEWGMYSLDYNDFLVKSQSREPTAATDATEDQDQDEDEDAPYFSLVTGRYEESKKSSAGGSTDLSALPGKGQLTAYNSQAVAFFKQREYQGLQTDVGQTEIHAAIRGQEGIASNYENR